jgi:hypothetical protein
MKAIKFLIAATWLASQAQAQGVRQCNPTEQSSDAQFLDVYPMWGFIWDDDANQPPYERNVAAHRNFSLPTLNYTKRGAPSHFPFQLTLLIDENGNVVCLSGDESPDASDMNPKRKAVLAAAADWRYIPFQINGKPHLTWVTEIIPEQIFMPHQMAMPKGALYDTSIKLSGYWGDVTLTGNGEGVYRDRWANSEINTSHTFSVSPGEVAALIERFRSADAWSLENHYIYRYVDDDAAPDTLFLRVGGQTKTVSYHNPEAAGMPRAAIIAILAFERMVDLEHSRHRPPFLDPPPIPAIPQPSSSAPVKP